jgi:DNA-binding IclR family transcriptional regulator
VADSPAARHALRTLAFLARQGVPIPAASIARELELPRSSTYRLLGVLIDEGFVVRVPGESRYGLGVAAFELGFAYTRQGPLQWMGHASLARLVDRTGHNGHLAVLHGRDVLYVVEERAPGRPSLVTEVGVRLPAHLTASGLAMLAALTPSQLRTLFPPRHVFEQRHERGPRSVSELRELLAAIRADHYALEEGSVTPGFSSVGCAVLDHGGHPAAAVALTFPARELDELGRRRLAVQVQATASELSRAVGGASAGAASASGSS